MRILLVASSAEFSTYDVYTGIRAGLIAEGHAVEDYLLYKRIKLMQHAFEAIAPEGQDPAMEMVCLHAAEAIPYRAIVTGARWVFIISGMGLHPNAVLALRRIGVKVACFFTEAPYDTIPGERELYLAQLVDVAFVNERTAVSLFQQTLDEAGHGGLAVYLPHAYNPVVHRPLLPEDEPLGGDEERCDVLLVGTGFAERQVLLEAIDWTGIDLMLGGLWPGVQAPSHLARYIRQPCMVNEYTARLYHGAKIVLNPHRTAEGAESANPRAYEVAACGAFQISDRRAEVVELFGDAVPTYEPGVPWQLAGLIRRYLADDAGRRQKAQAACLRVQGQTFRARARTIADTLEQFERRQQRQPGRLVAVS